MMNVSISFFVLEILPRAFWPGTFLRSSSIPIKNFFILPERIATKCFSDFDFSEKLQELGKQY